MKALPVNRGSSSGLMESGEKGLFPCCHSRGRNRESIVVLLAVLMSWASKVYAWNCFISEGDKWKKCQLICDLPTSVVVVYPEHEFGEESGQHIPIFYRRIDKGMPSRIETLAAGPLKDAGWSMQRGYETYERLWVHYGYGGPQLAFHGGEAYPKDWQKCRGSDSEDGSEFDIASCVTSRRTVYIESMPDLDHAYRESFGYETYDYMSSPFDSPSTQIDQPQPKIAALGANRYQLEFMRGSFAYRFDVSTSSQSPHAELSVFEAGRRLQTETCIAYWANDSGLIDGIVAQKASLSLPIESYREQPREDTDEVRQHRANFSIVFDRYANSLRQNGDAAPETELTRQLLMKEERTLAKLLQKKEAGIR